MNKLKTFNSELPFILPNWKGNPLDIKGRYVNLEFPFTTGFKDVWKWQTGPKPYKTEKKADTWRLETIRDESFITCSDDCLVWLGHAWFFMCLGGVNMLIDPVFFKIPMVKQLVANPYPPELFTNLDYILLSHDHRDHADKKSFKAICKLNPKAQIITGLNMTSLLRKWCKNKITEMGWYQQFQSEALKITFMPTRHWSRRLFTDTNLRLWGAFVIEAGGKTIYFGADSGYGNHYNELRQLFPSLDLAMLGIGAFRPEWFMAAAHMSPENAVRSFNESGAKTFLPMHYGSMDLSDEPIGEPYRMIQKINVEGEIKGKLLLPAVGETLLL